MDPETAQKLADMMEQAADKVFGPATPEFTEYLKKQKPIDTISIMGPNTHLGQFYWLEDTVCYSRTVIRGYYASKDYPFTKDDVFFTSFPKSGTTWLQMIGLHAINDCDVEKVKKLNVDIEIPTLELPECTLKVFHERKSPKYIKSHLPYSMLPPGICNKGYKIIHVTRNPKDLAVSLFHFYKMMKAMAFVGDMKSILNLFLNDAVLAAPFDKHCLGYWEHRNDDNVLFLTYEALHKDTFNQVKRICEFLGKNFSDDKIRDIVRATTFDQMASNPNAHHGQWAEKFTTADKFQFMRKGKIGDWKVHLDEEMNKKFDEWIEKRFGHSDITFDYE